MSRLKETATNFQSRASFGASGQKNPVRLSNVRTTWLHADADMCQTMSKHRQGDALPAESYLLIEDLETGDVLMPLIYMKVRLPFDFPHVVELNWYLLMLLQLKRLENLLEYANYIPCTFSATNPPPCFDFREYLPQITVGN